MMVTLANETGWNVPRLDGRMMNRIELKEEEEEGKRYTQKLFFFFFFFLTHVD